MFTASINKSTEKKFSEDEKIIMDYYGKNLQEYLLIEEMCQLSQSLIRTRATFDAISAAKPLSDVDLAGLSLMIEDDIADVLIAINHLILAFDIQDSVQDIIERKLLSFKRLINYRNI